MHGNAYRIISLHDPITTWRSGSSSKASIIGPLGKTNALQNKSSGFQQLTDETIAEAWERLQDYIAA
jgi:hypothetical protein